MRRALIAVCATGVMFGATAGSAGAATITPPGPADFGTVQVGESSPPKSFTLTIGPMELTYAPTINATPPFAQSNDCGILTQVQPTCTITATFKASSEGPANGMLTAGSGANPITLTGIGVEPKASGKKCKKKKGKKKKSAAAAKKCKKGKKKKKK